MKLWGCCKVCGVAVGMCFALAFTVGWIGGAPPEGGLGEGHMETPDDPPAAETNLRLQHRESPDEPPYLGPNPEPLLPPLSPDMLFVGLFESVQVNVDRNGRNIPSDAANEPSIAVDLLNPDRIAIGWRQFDSVNSNFRQAGWGHTQDGGLTWTFPGKLTPGFFRSDPVLDSDAEGIFYYYSLDGNMCCQMFISDDGGVSWSDPNPAAGGDKAWFGIDRTNGIGRGNIYATWNDSFPCTRGDFTRSTDGGHNFSQPVSLPGSVFWGTVAIGPAGELYLSSASEQVVKSTNARDPNAQPSFSVVGRAGLGGPVRSRRGPNPGGLLGQVWIAADHSDGPSRGHVYVLASVDPSGGDPLDVMITRSTNGGVNWDAPVRVNDDAPGTNAWQWFGTMSVAPSGRIDVIWNDTRNSRNERLSELFYAYSTDGGKTWSENTPASPMFDSHVGWPRQNKIGDYYDMVSDPLGAHLAYAATFNNEQDVYYLRIAIDCNNNGLHDGDDIASGRSKDVNGNGIPDECEGCVGKEKIKRANCKDRRGVNKMTVKLKGGIENDAFTVELSSGEKKEGTLNSRGKGKAKFKNLRAGPGTATAAWGCGAEAKKGYACP